MDKLEKILNRFKNDIVQGMDDKLRYATDLLRQEIRASEHRTNTELRQEMHDMEGRIRSDMSALEQRVTASVCSRIEDQLLPQVDEHTVLIKDLQTKIA